MKLAFWLFMLVMACLIPLTMLGFGKYFMENTPKKINSSFGYRTTMSMKNQDTWEFAHHYIGKLWYLCGRVALPLTIAAMFCLLGRAIESVAMAGVILCGAQTFVLLGTIVPTELALKKTFDKTGCRR